MFCRESVGVHYVPNAGFLEDVVLEDPAFLSSFQVSDSCEGAAESSNSQQNGIVNEGSVVDIGTAASELSPASATQNDSDSNVAEQVISHVGDLKLSENIDADESNEEQHVLTTEDLDAYLDKCLLQALHTTVKDKDLPMPGSTLW